MFSLLSRAHSLCFGLLESSDPYLKLSDSPSALPRALQMCVLLHLCFFWLWLPIPIYIVWCMFLS